MKIKYKPKNNLEKFGQKVYFLLVENSYPSYYVGGVVRDILLHRPVTDIDIATAAKPDQVVKLLQDAGMMYTKTGSKFGVITAYQGQYAVEITTFRKDRYGKSRYPEIKYIKSAFTDSKRRDFSINSLYLSLKTNEIQDFQRGLVDIKHKRIKFIGTPSKRIEEDPLRIVRALRFAITLRFKLEISTKKAIEKNFDLLEKITKTRLQKEINKLKNKKQRQLLNKFLQNKKYLT